MGLKWTMTFSILGYLAHALGQIYPTFYTLIPTGIISGLAASTLWAAHAQYLTVAAGKMAKIKNEENDKIVNRFFGVFFCIFHTNQIGNLVSSVVISGSGVPQFSELPVYSDAEAEIISNRCGINQPRFGDNETVCDGNTISDTTNYILMVKANF